MSTSASNVLYSETVLNTKILKFKKAQRDYINNRHAKYFDNCKKYSDDVNTYFEIHLRKFMQVSLKENRL